MLGVASKWYDCHVMLLIAMVALIPGTFAAFYDYTTGNQGWPLDRFTFALHRSRFVHCSRDTDGFP